MAGSGLMFNNTFDASCTSAYIACIVSAEDELESLFTNSVTINESFSEANQGNTGGALGNSFSYWNEFLLDFESRASVGRRSARHGSLGGSKLGCSGRLREDARD